MMQTIKAIETEYKGYRFRSRLEARWAVFFDYLNIEWEYEKEGYDLGNGINYLPDFWLPKMRRGMFFEVKGNTPSEDDRMKCFLLAEQSGFNVMLAAGTMGYKREEPEEEWYTLDFDSQCYSAYRCQHHYGSDREFFGITLPDFLAEQGYANKLPPGYNVLREEEAEYIKTVIDLDRDYFFTKYQKQHPKWKYGVCESLFISVNRNGHVGIDSFGDIGPWNDVFHAIDAARSARFEHGESGAT